MVEKVEYTIVHIILVAVGIFISMYSLFFIAEELKIYFVPMGIYIAVIALFVPFYQFYKKKKDIESNFPVFLRDVSQECEAGATLPKAIKSASRGSYGKLTEEIKRMVNEISLGLNVDQVLKNFSRRWKIPSINRSISSILEAEKAGGNLFKTLNSIAKSVYLLDDLKKERKSRSQSFTATSYVIFFILVAVLLVLLRILNSFVAAVSVGDFASTGMSVNLDIQEYLRVFQELIVVQGLFTGLAIGKTGEGDIRGGLIHMFVLSSLGFFAFTILVNIIIL